MHPLPPRAVAHTFWAPGISSAQKKKKIHRPGPRLHALPGSHTCADEASLACMDQFPTDYWSMSYRLGIPALEPHI